MESTTNSEMMMDRRTVRWLFALPESTDAASMPTKHQSTTAIASFTCMSGVVSPPVEASFRCQFSTIKRSLRTSANPNRMISKMGISLAAVTMKLRIAPSRMPAIRMAWNDQRIADPIRKAVSGESACSPSRSFSVLKKSAR